MSQQPDLEERVLRLEQLVDRVILKARTTQVGRQVLKMLGIE